MIASYGGKNKKDAVFFLQRTKGGGMKGAGNRSKKKRIYLRKKESNRCQDLKRGTEEKLKDRLKKRQENGSGVATPTCLKASRGRKSRDLGNTEGRIEKA